MRDRPKRPNGSGSVYQRRSDGRWVAKFTQPSGRVKIFYAYTEAEALQRLLEVRPNSLEPRQYTALPGCNIKAVSPKVRFAVLERDAYRCQFCGATASDGVRIEVDHVVPRTMGGSNDMSNLQTVCQLCNIGKGRRVLQAPTHKEGSEGGRCQKGTAAVEDAS